MDLRGHSLGSRLALRPTTVRPDVGGGIPLSAVILLHPAPTLVSARLTENSTPFVARWPSTSQIRQGGGARLCLMQFDLNTAAAPVLDGMMEPHGLPGRFAVPDEVVSLQQSDDHISSLDPGELFCGAVSQCSQFRCCRSDHPTLSAQTYVPGIAVHRLRRAGTQSQTCARRPPTTSQA